MEGLGKGHMISILPILDTCHTFDCIKLCSEVQWKSYQLVNGLTDSTWLLVRKETLNDFLV